MANSTGFCNDSIIDNLEALSGDGSCRWNPASGTWSFSRSYLALHGCKKSPASPEYLKNLYSTEDRSTLAGVVERVKRGELPPSISYRVLLPGDPMPRTMRLSCRALDGAGEEAGGFLFHVRDITDRIKKEEQLQFQSMLLDQIRDNITVTDLEGIITYVNETGCRTMGVQRENIVGKSIDLYGNDDKAGLTQRDILDETKRTGRWRGEVRNKAAEGRDVIMDVRTRLLLDDTGKPLGAFGISSDVTARVEAEDHIRKDLDEKDLLLREIHHRVKNNLQIISSLIALQAEGVTDPETLGIFADSRNRINAIALIHERLYRTHDIASIFFLDYAGDLVRDVALAYGVTERITLKFLDCSQFLNIDTAIPCGLILQELTANCFKHAFPPGTSGTVEVGLTFDGDDSRYRLSVADNGTGLPEGFLPEDNTSLGLRLVEILAAQLDGEVQFDHRQGTAVTVSFPG